MEWASKRMLVGKRVQDLTEPASRVIFLSKCPYRPGWYQHVTRWGEVLYHDCADFYLSHRKGWSLGIQQTTPELIESLGRRGADYVCYFVDDDEYLFVNRHPDWLRTLGDACTPMEVTAKWGIYRLARQARNGRRDKDNADYVSSR